MTTAETATAALDPADAGPVPGETQLAAPAQPRKRWEPAVRWAIALLFLAYMSTVFISSFAVKLHLDFNNLYVGGEIFSHADGARLYDPNVQIRYQSQFLGTSEMMFLSTPPVATLFGWVKPFSPDMAFLLWTLASMVLFALAAVLLQRQSGISWGIHWFLPLAFLYPPLDYSLMLGQVDCLQLLALAAGIALLDRRMDVAAGLAFAFGLVKFPILIPFVIVFLLLRRWKILAGLVAGGIVSLGYSLAVCGTGSLKSYLALVRYVDARLDFGTNPMMMPNLRGLMYAATRGYNIPMWWSMLLTVALCLWAARHWKDDRMGVARLAAIATIAGHHVHPHDLVLLLPLFAFTLPSLRWKSLAGVLFVLLATPVLNGVRLGLNGFWFEGPLILLYMLVTVHFPMLSRKGALVPENGVPAEPRAGFAHAAEQAPQPQQA
jgi:hypothetical protein